LDEKPHKGARSRHEVLESLRVRYVALCELVAHLRSAFSRLLIIIILDAGWHLMIITYMSGRTD
jgi:hypothetical protein